MSDFIPYDKLTPEQKAQVDSPDWKTRYKAGVFKGYGLDKLIDDKKDIVRAGVAECGYGLDKLIKDESSFVRSEVAKQRYGLDKLINDPEWVVRYEVANQGYGLERLAEDPVYSVRMVTQEHLNHLENLKEKALSQIRDGQCISFPVPAFNSEHALIDMFFVYTIEQSTRIPNEPIYCLEFDRTTDIFTKVDTSLYFKDIKHDPTSFETPADYEQAANKAWDMYTDVRAEILCGGIDWIAKKYAGLITKASQKCLIPYYAAIAPELFE